MKTILYTALALIPMSLTATQNQTNYFMPTSYVIAEGNTNNEDTANIFISNKEITIIDNDTSVRVSVADQRSQKTGMSNLEQDSIIPKKFKDVNVEIIEANGNTRIIVYKQGDTVQHFEMNLDNFEKSNKAPSAVATENHTPNEDPKTIVFNKKKNKAKFKGHWSGLEMGLNNYLTNDLSMDPGVPYMELNSGKSWNFNFNFAQTSVPLIGNRVGLVSGLGLEWSNYHFTNNNTIYKDGTTNTIAAYDLSGIPLKKNRLQTTYLTAPLLLEIQLGSSNLDKRLSIAGGVIGGLKLGAHTKYKTNNDKNKNKDDFYLQTFRYGFTARVNYGNIGLYFNYYDTPLFIKGKGPAELHPFASGLVFSFD